MMRIGIAARLDIHKAIELTDDLTDFLIKNNVEVFLDPALVKKLNKYHDSAREIQDMDVDIIIAIGGDGTILRTQSFIDGKNIPIFGINMGTVGFLTEIGPEESFHALKKC